jgi:feruloyl esterase
MPDDGLLVDFIPHIATTAELRASCWWTTRCGWYEEGMLCAQKNEPPRDTMRTLVLLCWIGALSLSASPNPGALRTGDAAAGCGTLAAAIDARGSGCPAAAPPPAATLMAIQLSVAERGPTPAATITPAAPQYCKVLGRIAPVDPKAPPIQFEVNLPT